MLPIYLLPNDIINKIITYLDIDTRIIIGKYEKIKISNNIIDNLNFMLNRYKIKLIKNDIYPKVNIAILDLNSLYILEHKWYINKKNIIQSEYIITYHDYLYGREYMTKV